MGVMDCVPMLIPLIAATMSLQLFSMIPISVPGGQPVLTLLIMYVVTYLYAKIFNCWSSSKRIWARSFVPILIFVVWVIAFFSPIAPIMMAIGNNPILIAVLSIVYKLAYDHIFKDC